MWNCPWVSAAVWRLCIPSTFFQTWWKFPCLISLPLNSAKLIKYSCLSDLFHHFTTSNKHNKGINDDFINRMTKINIIIHFHQCWKLPNTTILFLLFCIEVVYLYIDTQSTSISIINSRWIWRTLNMSNLKFPLLHKGAFLAVKHFLTLKSSFNQESLPHGLLSLFHFSRSEFLLAWFWWSNHFSTSLLSLALYLKLPWPLDNLC